MSIASLDRDKFNQLTSLGWAFRGYYKNGSMGKGSITDRDALVTVDTYRQYDGLAVVPALCEADYEVICIDNDYTHQETNKRLKAYLDTIANNRTIGHPDKLGKYFFQYNGHKDKLDFKIGLIEVFHAQNRCNIFGAYKDSGRSYKHDTAYPHVLSMSPSDLPVIDDEAFTMLAAIVGSEIVDDNKELSRHHALMSHIGRQLLLKPYGVVIKDIEKHEAYLSLKNEGRDGKSINLDAEVRSIIKHSIGKIIDDPEQAKSFALANNDEKFELKPSDNEFDIIPVLEKLHAQVDDPEENSLAMILYRLAEKASHVHDTKPISWFSVKACLKGGVLATKFRVGTTNVRTASVIVAPSGSGKSISQSLTTFLVNLSSDFASMVTDFENRQAFEKKFQYNNRLFVVRDEAQEIFDKKAQESGITRAFLKYLNNAGDDDFSTGVNIKEENYGYCYAPIASTLFSTTESFMQRTKGESLSDGLARRLDMYVHNFRGKFKVDEYVMDYADVPEALKARLRSMISFLFQGSTGEKIPKGMKLLEKKVNEKGRLELVPVTQAVHRKTINLPLSDEAKHIYRELKLTLNNYREDVRLKYGEMLSLVLDSAKEKVMQDACFYDLCCRKEPSKEITAMGIKWAIREFIRFQWVSMEYFAESSNSYIDTEEIKLAYETIYSKIRKQKEDKISNSKLKRFLPESKSRYFDQCINQLILNEVIKKVDSKRKNYISYEIIKESGK